MKKLLLLGAVAALLTAASAPAKTVGVDISKLGFVPSALTVQIGDSVTWTNKDTANHQVVCATCTFTSPVLKPNETYTYTFAKVGKFTTVDALNKNKKGTVTVQAAPPAVTVSATPGTVNYGSASTIAGNITPGLSGQKVDIVATACGTTSAKVVATVTTTSGGAYTYQAQAPLLTAYQARYKPTPGAAVLSSSLNVAVRPIVTLKRLAAGKFSAKVTAAQSFVGKTVAFQRWVVSTRKWTTLRSPALTAQSTISLPLAGTIASVGSFKVKLRSGYRVRAVLPPAQTGSCYLSGSSVGINS